VNKEERDRLAWHKSTRSNGQANCVEVAEIPSGDYAVRDSKNADGPILVFGSSTWTQFIEAVKSDFV
jgi:hypothetical protein